MTLIPVLLLSGLFLNHRLEDSVGIKGRRERVVSAFRIYVPFAVLLGAYLFYEYVIQRQSGLIRQGLYAPHIRFIYSLGKYLATLCIPYVDLLLDALSPISVVLCIGLVVVCVYLSMRTSGPIRLLLSWLLISVLPFSLFVGRVASRYCYLPSVPFSIGVGLLIVRGWPAMDRRLAMHTAHILFVGCLLAGHLAITQFNEIRFDVRSARTEHFLRQIVPLLSELRTGEEVYVVRSPLDEAHLQAALRVYTGHAELIAHGIHEDRMRAQGVASIPPAREGVYVLDVEGDRVYRRQ